MMVQFTERAGRVLAAAWQISLSYDNEYIGTEHILAGILTEESGLASKTLSKLGLTLSSVISTLTQFNQKEPKKTSDAPQIDGEKLLSRLTPRTRQVLNIAAREAQTRNVAQGSVERSICCSASCAKATASLFAS